MVFLPAVVLACRSGAEGRRGRRHARQPGGGAAVGRYGARVTSRSIRRLRVLAGVLAGAIALTGSAFATASAAPAPAPTPLPSASATARVTMPKGDLPRWKQVVA